jgi:hypothetical protein
MPAPNGLVSSCAHPKSDRGCGSIIAINRSGRRSTSRWSRSPTYSGEPTILALVNFGSGLALIGSDGRSGAMVPRNRRFVFALPARDRLEARRDGEPVIP